MTDPSNTSVEMHRSVLILIIALSLVVVLSIALFQHPPASDSAAARAIQAPRDRFAELMQTGRRMYTKTGDYHEAEKYFREACTIDPTSSEALDAVGQMVLLDGRYEEAYELFKMADALSPAVSRYEADMAIALLCLKRYEEAEDIARTGSKRYGAPRHEFALILACAAQEQGRRQPAENLIAEVHDLIGNDIIKIVSTHAWAKPLQKSPTYRKILKASLPDYAPPTPAPQPAAAD